MNDVPKPAVNLWLRSVAYQPFGAPSDHYPYTTALVRSFTRLEFSSPVTFLVGENGSGKSTLLEALACACGSITVGSESVLSDPSLAPVRRFAQDLRLAWSKRTRKGFFMRAEDFFGYARSMNRMRQELEEDLSKVNEEYKDRSATAQNFARLPFQQELGAIRRAYGQAGLDGRSHGEAFLALFKERFSGPGLYLLDEPEAPLSPIRQLSFLALLHTMTTEGGQFIIATHSPIIMAFPGATILNFDGETIQPVAYESLEHVEVTRTFLNDPQAYLRHLLE